MTSRDRPLVAVRAPSSAIDAAVTVPAATTAIATPAASVVRSLRAAEDEGDGEHHREQRHEAGLRVREVQSGEQHHGQRQHDRRAGTAQPEADQEHRDRGHEVAAVEAGVLEHRRDAEERRVRVRHLQVGCEEQGARVRLPQPDDARRRCRARRASRQVRAATTSRAASGRRAPARVRTAGRRTRARCCRRGGRASRAARRTVSATNAVTGRARNTGICGRRGVRHARHEGCERRRGEHGVQGEQQERLLVGHLDRDSEGRRREQRHRDDRRQRA